MILESNKKNAAHPSEQPVDYQPELARMDVQLQNATAKKIDAIGGKIGDEADRMIKMLDAVLGSTATHNNNLADAGHDIENAKSPEALRAIVNALVRATREVEQQNRDLQTHLQKSRNEITELQTTLEATRTEGLTDALTTLTNRRGFDDALERAIAESKHSHQPLSLLICDVDHFKKFNDTFGHVTGDQVLRLLGLTIKQSVRGQDTPTRYGGEEFAIILPNTSSQQALSVAENIRTALSEKKLINRATNVDYGKISISVGVAEFRANDSSESLIKRADRCLYAAKQQGRNRVVSVEPVTAAA